MTSGVPYTDNKDCFHRLRFLLLTFPDRLYALSGKAVHCPSRKRLKPTRGHGVNADEQQRRAGPMGTILTGVRCLLQWRESRWRWVMAISACIVKASCWCIFFTPSKPRIFLWNSIDPITSARPGRQGRYLFLLYSSHAPHLAFVTPDKSALVGTKMQYFSQRNFDPEYHIMYM